MVQDQGKHLDSEVMGVGETDIEFILPEHATLTGYW